MAKQIIVLETNSAIPQKLQIRYILWLTTLLPVPKPNAVSAWTGASAAEITALQNGTTIEEAYADTFPSSLTPAQIKVILQADYTARQSYLASVTQPGAYYGVFFDGTVWSA